MLKITRNKGETLVIGDDVRVHHLGYRNGEVKFGISAPKHISVDRMELREQKSRQKRSEEDM